MVLLSASAKLNQWLGPRLLRLGIQLRYTLAGGILRDNPWADALCGITVAQKLIQIEVHDEAKSLVSKELKENPLYSDHDEAVTRLSVLEKYLRPALIPNEKWHDVSRWQFHSRLIKWIRMEFLTAKHGATIRKGLQTFPALRKSPQMRGLRDAVPPSDGAPAENYTFNLFNYGEKRNHIGNESNIGKLPTSAVVTKAFDMHDWNIGKNMIASRSDMLQIAGQLQGSVLEIRGGNVAIAHISDSADLTDVPLEQVLEVAGGHVMQCGPLNAFCEEAGIYQLWTREYVEQLGRYIIQRSAVDGRDTVVLDVGAGDGLLAQLLREFFDSEHGRSTIQEPISANRSSRQRQSTQSQRKMRIPRRQTKVPIVVASDDGTWGIPPIGNVERQTVQEAIDAYASQSSDNQVIVLCSWMPMNEDWSATFRSRHVDEYILIGEYDDGQCGDNWETWGNPKHLLDDIDGVLNSSNGLSDPVICSEGAALADRVAPFIADGYERYCLDELTHFQYSRFDCRSSKFGGTVSFRRRQA